MHRRIFIWHILFLLLLYSCKQNQKTSTFPNIIVFIADDLGYGDLGCFGSADINTPNIDNLANHGVRFTNYYANGPECTPTRVAFLTGRYQQRAGGLECAVGAGNVGRYNEAEWLADRGELGLPVSENLLVKVLKQNDYQTGMMGKWHLGYEKKFRPIEHGFDYSFGSIGYGGDYFYHTEQVETGLEDLTGMHTLMENNKEVFYTGEYATKLFTEKAIEWLTSRNKEKPFFLYLPYTAPHTPYQGPGDLIDRPLRAEEWNVGNRETYVEMVEALDSGMGEILTYLEENKMDEETLVIFFSDNGGAKIADNGPFSGNKGQVFEGGIHVPCIIRWPGKVEAGKVSEQTCISFDLTKSIINLVEPETEEKLDGYDILNHVIADKANFARTLFWRKKRGNLIHKAIRDGNMKYLTRMNGDSVLFEKVINLNDDPAEKNNLINQLPETAQELKYKLRIWENEVQSPRLSGFKK
jgi:N-acetylgalactosamine-6-sulfatase